MAAEEGNRYLREMGPGLATSLCKSELRGDPIREAEYDRWCAIHQDQLRTMDSEYRAIGSTFIHAKVKS